jgi:hypothetical protein
MIRVAPEREPDPLPNGLEVWAAEAATLRTDVHKVANSRGPETLTDLVGEIGPNARAATVAEATGRSRSWSGETTSTELLAVT